MTSELISATSRVWTSRLRMSTSALSKSKRSRKTRRWICSSTRSRRGWNTVRMTVAARTAFRYIVLNAPMYVSST